MKNLLFITAILFYSLDVFAKVNQPEVDFDATQVGKNSTQQEIVVTNPEGGKVEEPTTIDIKLTGDHPGDFSQTSTCPTSLEVGGECTITVTFTPQAEGSRNATLVISDRNSVALKGEGTAGDAPPPLITDYPQITPVFSLDNNGQLSDDSTAQFYGGISVNNASFALTATNVKQLKVEDGKVTQGDIITVKGVIIPDPAHVDKKADIIVVALYSVTDNDCNPSQGDYYMLTKPERGNLNNNYCAWIFSEGEKPDYCHHDAPAQDDYYYEIKKGHIPRRSSNDYWNRWNGKLDGLLPLSSLEKLSSKEEMMLYQDKARYTGYVCINFGYRLQDEPKMLVFNGEPIKFSVVP